MTEEARVRATVKRERHFRAFPELSKANRVLLENAREGKSGCFYEYMATIVISAFKFEAYLNYAGAKIISDWAKIKGASHRKKLERICSKVGIAITDSKRPYQTLLELRQFRNALAHGRDEQLDPKQVIEEGTLEELRRKAPLTRWEQLCTLEFAERAHEDTEEIVRQIHKAGGWPEDDLLRDGHSYAIKDAAKLD